MSPTRSLGRSLLPPCWRGPCVVFFFFFGPPFGLSFFFCVRLLAARRAVPLALSGRSGCPFSFCVRSSRFRCAASFVRVRACPVRPVFFFPLSALSARSPLVLGALEPGGVRSPPFFPSSRSCFPFGSACAASPQPARGPFRATASPTRGASFSFLSSPIDNSHTAHGNSTDNNQRRASFACDKKKRGKNRLPLCLAVSFFFPVFFYFLFLFTLARFVRAQEDRTQTTFSPRFSLFFIDRKKRRPPTGTARGGPP